MTDNATPAPAPITDELPDYPLVPCTDCGGIGNDTDANRYGPTDSPPAEYQLDASRHVGEVVTCTRCKGYGITRKSGEAYRSPSSAKSGKTRGTAKPCQDYAGRATCNGTGRQRSYPVLIPCRGCDGTGTEVAYTTGRHRLPDHIGRTDHLPKDFRRQYFADVDVHILFGARLAHAETLLGALRLPRTIVTCTDYGAAWERAGAGDTTAVIERVRDHGFTQWSNVIDPNTREVATTLTVVIRPNGYSVHGGYFDTDAGVIRPYAPAPMVAP